MAELSSLPVDWMYGDVVDHSSLRPAIEGCEIVFHLAAIRRAPSREHFFRANAQGTANLCEAMSQANGRLRLVLCSGSIPDPIQRSVAWYKQRGWI